MVSDSLDGSKVFARVARESAMQPDLANTLRCLVRRSAQLIGCETAALWELKFGTRPSLRACTDEQVGLALSNVLEEIDEGPVRQALANRSTCLMVDLDTETRWPRYVADVRGRGLPVRSALAFSLDLGEKDFGVLVLYASQPGYFTEDIIDIGGVLADHAALALNAAQEAAAATQLRRALNSNRRIGMAMGVLMALHQITEDQAFAMLRAASQKQHVKLHALAEDVILTGALPTLQSAA